MGKIIPFKKESSIGFSVGSALFDPLKNGEEYLIGVGCSNTIMTEDDMVLFLTQSLLLVKPELINKDALPAGDWIVKGKKDEQ